MPPSSSQSRAAGQEQASRDDRHFAHAVAAPFAERLGVEQVGAAEDGRSPPAKQSSDHRRRSAPARGRVERPVLPHRPPAVDAVLGVLRREPEQGLERTGERRRVGVQEQDELAVAGANPAVHAPREPDVLADIDEKDLGVRRRDRLDAAVGRAVVHQRPPDDRGGAARRTEAMHSSVRSRVL